VLVLATVESVNKSHDSGAKGRCKLSCGFVQSLGFIVTRFSIGAEIPARIVILSLRV
jgi:hypothetical protein